MAALGLQVQVQAQGFGDEAAAFYRNLRVSRGRYRCSSSAVVEAATSTAPVSEITRLRKQLLGKEVSAVGIVKEYLARVEEKEPELKSFLHVSTTALEEAAEIDKLVQRGEEVGVLAGIPVAVKDNMCTQGMPSTGGSRILHEYVPPYDATAVKRLKDAGAVIIGKTNLDEFGMGSSTEGSAYQVTANPWDLSRVPGGSSGGSAASVAAKQCVCSLGSDTGGSIRQPASFCGVVGIKPTYGLVSRFGLMAYASSLDVVGCLGSSIYDTALLLSVIAGHDPRDSTSSLKDVPNYVDRLLPADSMSSKPLTGMKFGLIRETLGEGVDACVVSSVRGAARHLEELGASVVEVSLGTFQLGLPAYYVLASSEASSNLARYDGVRYGPREAEDELNAMYGSTRGRCFGSEVKRRILMGTYALSAGYYDAFYKRAQQVRTLIQNDFKKAFDEVDMLLSPVAPSPAFKIGEKVKEPLSMYLGDLMTVNVNLAGLPALSLPCGVVETEDSKLPVGVQFIGKAFEEGELLRVAHIFEQTLST